MGRKRENSVVQRPNWMYILCIMKKPLILIAMAVVLFAASEAEAQLGFNPEFLGNAAGAPGPGFCLKFFTSYDYQHSIAAQDIETAFEPQYFFPGFTGDAKRDQIQVIAHLPVGYRRQKVPTGTVESVTGIGLLTVNVEHFWHLIDEEDMQLWFDNAITTSYPTSTENEGISAGGDAKIIRIGGNSFAVGWFTESFFRYKDWLFSVNPVVLVWAFEDERTHDRSGLNISVMNSSVGYQVSKNVGLGVDFGMILGNVAGSSAATGGELPLVLRAYAGPAMLINLPKTSSLQIGSAIDFATKNAAKGMGIFTALWHQF